MLDKKGIAPGFLVTLVIVTLIAVLVLWIFPRGISEATQTFYGILSPESGCTADPPDIESRIKQAACREDVPPDIALAVAVKESGMVHCREGSVITSKSTPPSVGIMQIYPSTGRTECGLDRDELNDVDKNIGCGIKVLKKYYGKWKGGNENPACKKDAWYQGVYREYRGWKAALRAYNGWGCVPPGADVDYVEKVMDLRDKKFAGVKCS